MNANIAILGSAFNPPSLGHKQVIESLSHFDVVLLVPSIAHAWGKVMLDYELRCNMVSGFIHDIKADHDDLNVQLSTIEQVMVQPDQSVTTYALLTELQKQYPESSLTFVIGPDNFFKFSSFHKAEEIVERWSVLACPEKVKIRSTDIRKNLVNNQPIDDLTTPAVVNCISQGNLYQ